MEKKQINKQKKYLQSFFIAFSLACVLVFLIGTYFYTFVNNQSYGMLPTLTINDKLLVRKHTVVEYGDIVYFKLPGKLNQFSFSRIIGTAGDQVWQEGGHLFRNGVEIRQELILETEQSQMADFDLLTLTGVSKVPEKMYFIMGDNCYVTADSRDFGYISENQIIGKLESRLFPKEKRTGF